LVYQENLDDEKPEELLCAIIDMLFEVFERNLREVVCQEVEKKFAALSNSTKTSQLELSSWVFLQAAQIMIYLANIQRFAQQHPIHEFSKVRYEESAR